MTANDYCIARSVGDALHVASAFLGKGHRAVVIFPIDRTGPESAFIIQECATLMKREGLVARRAGP